MAQSSHAQHCQRTCDDLVQRLRKDVGNFTDNEEIGGYAAQLLSTVGEAIGFLSLVFFEDPDEDVSLAKTE